MERLATAGLLLALLGAPPSLGSGSSRAPQDGRPNLVLILSDDHRWDALGAAGNERIHTPELDRLAREGLYFSQATIHVSQCPPSRATLLTGLPPHLHGVHALQHQEPRAKTTAGLCGSGTLPALLREAGYTTGLVGKWHLAPDPWRCGFEEIGTWIPAGAAPFRDPDRLARGRSWKTRPVSGYTQEILVEDALAFIARHAGDEAPFFLWLAVTAPHYPYSPNPPRIRELYAGKNPADLLPPGFPAQAPVHSRWVEYYQAVSHLDEQVGRLLRALEGREGNGGPKRPTVVAFLGDNGYMMGERGIGLEGPSGKVVPYEASLRVPFLLAGVPGLRGTDPSPVSSLDLPPTLLALAGVPPPAAWPGRDVVTLLQRGEAIPYAVSEWSDDVSEPFGALAYRVIRTPRFKLIDWQNPERKDELYDLRADPHETRNLIGDPEQAETLRELSSQLLDWRKSTRDPALRTAPGENPVAPGP